MLSIGKITNYINSNNFEVHLYKNKINIVNYTEISDFTNNKIIVKHSEGTITIIGVKLVISKLLDDEILISGDIKQIELG